MDVIELTDVGDAHVHFRQNKQDADGGEELTDMLSFAVPKTSEWASFALPMPNTIPSIRTGAEAVNYNKEIRAAASNPLEIISCIKAIEGFTTVKTIRDASQKGVRAIKVYFEGTTTNAYQGDAVTWDGFFRMIDVWRECAEYGIVICLHLERPGVFVLRREFQALELLEWLVENTNAKIVVEHVTDRRTLERIFRLPDRVACTITAHHAWGDLDMVAGGNLNVHAFCKPLAKEPEDCRAIRQAIISRDPKFMFGSDSAPHPLEDKQCEGCAGVFTGPFCLPMLAHILEEEGCRDIQGTLQDFAGNNARRFYKLREQGRKVYLAKEPFTIPNAMQTPFGILVVPFLKEHELNYRLLGEHELNYHLNLTA